MEGQTLTFKFGDFGSTPVTLFHPAPNTYSKRTHLLFIPPSGVADIAPYKERLDALAMADRGWLYALCFPPHLPANDPSLVKLVHGALLFLRAGSDTFKIIICDNETHPLVRRDERWREEKDLVITFPH